MCVCMCVCVFVHNNLTCFDSATINTGSIHSVMLTKLQEMDAQLTAIENTAKKVEGEFQDSNQVQKHNLPSCLYTCNMH